MLERTARFDWYQSTVMVQCPQDSGLVDVLLRAWPLSDWVPARNLNGYTRGGAISRGDRILCHVCWGGQTGVSCKSTSDESPVLAQALAEFRTTHRPTRVDSCVDWCEPGLFDSLSGELIRYAQENRLSINQQGDWVRGEARTLYVGSKDSPVRLVLYEKGYEQGGDAPKDWVRLEVRIRPKSEWRERVARWSADEVFCAGWVPDALAALGWDDLAKRVVGTVWKVSDDQRALAALCRQYGNLLGRLVQDVGSAEALGVLLVNQVNAQKAAPGARGAGSESLVKIAKSSDKNAPEKV